MAPWLDLSWMPVFVCPLGFLEPFVTSLQITNLVGSNPLITHRGGPMDQPTATAKPRMLGTQGFSVKHQLPQSPPDFKNASPICPKG